MGAQAHRERPCDWENSAQSQKIPCRSGKNQTTHKPKINRKQQGEARSGVIPPEEIKRRRRKIISVRWWFIPSGCVVVL